MARLTASLREAGWLALVLIAGGCATAGSSTYQALQAEYLRSATPRPAVRVDDEVLRGPLLERAAYVRAVLHRNPSVESARQGWRAAIARVRQAGSFEDPMIDLSAAPLSIGQQGVPFGYNIGISQRLPWFGKRGLQSVVAAAEAKAAGSDLLTTRRELARTAVLLYDEYFVAVRSIEINRQHIALLGTLHASLTSQLESGRVAVQDALQAEVELAHMERDAVVLESQREVTVIKMNELLHRDPELPLPPPPGQLPTPNSDMLDLKGLQRDAVERRPDIRMVRERADAEQARADRAERDYYPDFSVSTSYNSMWDMPEHRWMVGIGLNLPLQVERRAGMVDEAKAARARFDSEAIRLSDMARSEVVVALKQLQQSRQVLAILETKLLPSANRQIEAARAGFVASRNDFLAVIGAERSLRSVELEYQLARADFDRQRAELDYALGRMPGLDETGLDETGLEPKPESP